jgi:signal transduction histidine kinase
LRLTVCDNGDPIPERIAANLLRGIVVSEQGLGIGLYQAARWAGQLGYRLSLISNRAGKVCFELQENNGMKERRNLNL